MPVNRRPTPPTSRVKKSKGVLNSLNAWTDIEDDTLRNRRASVEEEKTAIGKLIDPDSDNFNILVGIVIIANALTIGLETEFGSKGFVCLEHLFLLVFVTEMVLRVRKMGNGYFKEGWNLFDFTLVCTGTLDLWILPLFTTGQHTQGVLYHFSAIRMLRILRLMRILRVVRLFRMFQELYLIMQAFNKAFQIVVLIGLLVLIIDYVCAILLTRGIGQQSHMWSDHQDQVKVEFWFGSISSSMQTLFVIMTLSDWNEISDVLVKELPSPVVYTALVIYIMVTSYTMSSLITGIISESLLTAQQEHRLHKEKIMDDNKKELTCDLREFLYQMHEDEKDEMNMVKIEDLKTSMRGDTELLDKLASINVNIEEEGILALIERLKSKDQAVNLDHFVDKLTNLVGGATASSIMDLKYEIFKINTKVNLAMQKMGIVDPFECEIPVKNEQVQLPEIAKQDSGKRRSSLRQAGQGPLLDLRTSERAKAAQLRFQES